VKEELRKRRAIAELAGMDDRTLRDIGIGRSEIESAVRASPAHRRSDGIQVLSDRVVQNDRRARGASVVQRAA